jgi:carboxymethylenebutenolidase
MGATIRLNAADGHVLDAWRAEPAGAAKAGLVVMQEAFGVNHHIKSVCDRYAAIGYAAIAPAIYDRQERDAAFDYGEDGMAKALAHRARLDWDAVMRDVDAAVAALRPAGRVGIVGYCVGGAIAWMAACRVNVDAASCYYGTDIPKLYRETPRCPVMLHFAREDSFIALSDVEKITAAHPGLPAYVYPAVHGFNCDVRARSYHPESARLALERTLAFFAAHLVKA